MAMSVSADDFARLLRHRAVSEGASLLEHGSSAGRIAALSGEIRQETVRFFDLLEVKVPAKKASFTEPSEELRHQQAVVSEKVHELLRFFAPLVDGQEEPDPEQSAAAVWAEELRRVRHAMQWCTEVKNYPSWAYWKEGRSLSSAPAAPFAELADSFQLRSP